jgi:hypothetical protein
VYVQKRLILANIKEIYKQFKDDNSNEKVGFSKFCELSHKNCVLVGGCGTHTVVCTLHQNVKLMLLGFRIKSFTADDSIQHFQSVK